MFSYLNDLLSGTQVNYLYWALALVGTLLFAISGLFSLFGGGMDADMPDTDDPITAHFDTDLGFRLVSIRSVLAFVTVFGWGGVLWGDNGWVGFLGALACGFATMVLTAAIIYGAMRMQMSGNISNASIVGMNGIVYVTIPAGRNNAGKVTVVVNGTTREIRAVSDQELPTGTPVVIKEMIAERRYLVEKES